MFPSVMAIAHPNANLGFINPIELGGYSNFTFINSPTTKPEPLNIVISGLSDFPSNIYALSGQKAIPSGNVTSILYEPHGLADYLNALNFSDECLHLHLSTPAMAAISSPNLHLLDFLYREDFGVLDAQTSGSCRETLEGGYHFRGFRQNQTGAWFLGASQELNLTLKHDLVPNGYDLGRDEVVRRARIGGVDGRGCTWPAAEVRDARGVLSRDDGSSWNHGIGIDGLVKVIIVGSPSCNARQA